MHQRVVEALSAGGALARANPHFVPRLAQQELATSVADAIASSGLLVAEAGTGTGKTFAYLIPALLTAGKVLIATGTRNLQDQLFDRDLPQVREALGVAASVALLKGRSNYVCHYHLARNLLDGRFASRADIADLKRIEQFSQVSPTGDRSALPLVAEDAPAWSQAISTRENCLGSECPDHGRCFVVKARQNAQQADLVVVNHHLFCADLALRDEGIAELLPEVSAVIFDEAHQLAEVATQFLGESVSSRQIIEFGRDCLRYGLAGAADSADWMALSSTLEQVVRELRLAAGSPRRIDQADLLAHKDLIECIRQCAKAIGILSLQLDQAAQRSPDLARCALRASEIEQRLTAWIIYLTEPVRSDAQVRESDTGRLGDDEKVFWAEVTQSGCTLNATPLSVAAPLQKHLGQRPCAYIFLSATLSVSGSLEHFAQTLGLGQAEKKIWPSPFDYPRNGLLYVPEKLPLPSSEGFAEQLIEAAWPLLKANRGRAFVLCTTLRMVERLSQLLQLRLDAEEPTFLLLIQGKSTRAELLNRFRSATAPILVGSASFWEGVDVPGDQLSLVIVDKLPFAPPDDPVLRARSDQLKRAGKDAFRELHLPAAAMSLKQGAGRLIRSEQDYGVLMVGDTRLADKAYGRSLLKSLPPFARTRQLQAVLEFVRQRGAPVVPSGSPGALIST
jgi:ATP-dependent DNA helicase DinG